ncbi:17988_t:CDS:2 [Rhizophagus irregularis]|nr:17988_t:CDS:2 [Rhizophagus irregularis]
MPVVILGTQITLWCFDLRNDSKFKVIIGDGNDIDDFKEAIKEKCKPFFDGFGSYALILWRVNATNATQVTPDILNDKLVDTAKTIEETFSNIQGSNIRVVVRAPESHNKFSQRQGNFPDIASLEKKFEKVVNEVGSLRLEVERDFRKMRNVIKASLYSPGTFTETEKGKLVNKGDEIGFPLNLTTSSKQRAPGRFTESPNKVPTANPKEEKIRDYFMSECLALENSSSINNKLVIKDTRSSPLLETRKPDFVFIPNDSHLDQLNVVAVGEVKKRTGGGFSNAHIGQAISYGEKTLLLQPRRNSIFVVLTDCLIINVYRVTRINNTNLPNPVTQFKYERIAPQNLIFKNGSENTGWKYLVTIMESSPDVLGWVKPSLTFGNETVSLVRSIGVGRTSVVYEGKHNEVSMAVKMAKKIDYLPCFTKERIVLEKLSELESPHIPKILFYNDDVLVLTPLGEKINNLRKKDIKDIITTLQNAHSLGIIHRDLRKFNLYRNLDDLCENILIVDWGYSVNNSESAIFAGALECMPDYVLQSLINGEQIAYGPQVDLTCFVRSFYLMLHRPTLDRVPFGKDDNIEERAHMLLNFWKDCRQSDVWNNIYEAIDNLRYDQLIQELEKLF